MTATLAPCHMLDLSPARHGRGNARIAPRSSAPASVCRFPRRGRCVSSQAGAGQNHPERPRSRYRVAPHVQTLERATPAPQHVRDLQSDNPRAMGPWFGKRHTSLSRTRSFVPGGHLRPAATERCTLAAAEPMQIRVRSGRRRKYTLELTTPELVPAIRVRLKQSAQSRSNFPGSVHTTPRHRLPNPSAGSIPGRAAAAVLRTGSGSTGSARGPGFAQQCHHGAGEDRASASR
jgi:hypothetical protein